MYDSETFAPLIGMVPRVIPVVSIFMKIEISFKYMIISPPVSSCVIFPVLSNFERILASFSLWALRFLIH